MKKFLITLIISTIMCSAALPVNAEENKQALNPQVIQEIQLVNQQYEVQRKKVSEVIDEVNQSVVAIIGRNTKYRENNNNMYSKFPTNLQHGSGVVVDVEGRIITNNHVVDGLDEIYVVTYDGNVYNAKLLYANSEIDLALLKINRSDLKPIKFAKEEEIKVGDEVVAIGTPLFFGYRNSASKGIVSGLNRPIDNIYTYLQTDAAINPGNSGGPLVNMNSELVAINTLGYMFYSGVNFSIPIGNVSYFIEQYDKFGRIKRCFTGIEFEENWAALLGLPTNQGLKVITIKKDAVVTSNQVYEGDMLEAIDSKSVTSIAQYNEILKSHLPGDKVTLTLSREGSKFNLTVELKELLKEDKK